MTEKYNFAWPVTAMAYEDYEALKICIEKNHKQFENKQIILFGAGIRGSVFAVILKQLEFNNLVFTDNNEKKWNGCINEFPIKPVTVLQEHLQDSIVIITVENGEGIKVQLEEIGFVENETYFLVKTDIYDIFMQEFHKKMQVETLIFGDCGLSQVAIYDKEYENLGNMLKKSLTPETTKVLATHGMGMRAFYNILLAQCQMGMKPRKFALMVNFEVFTGTHHLFPRTQHVPLIERIYKETGIENEELTEYRNLVHTRVQQLKLDVFSSREENANNDLNRMLILRKNYMYKLKFDSEDMEYLKKILLFCKAEGIKVIPFIPPANYQLAESFFHEKFHVVYDENCDKMKKYIAELGYEVLDLSYLLSSECFADVNTIDETTNYNGRVLWRDKLVERILEE